VQATRAAAIGTQDEQESYMKINFGCGNNVLDGWVNHDADVDITTRLPFEDGVARFILCEHAVEHIGQKQAIGFFKECHRILRRGGVARIIVPSIAQIWSRGTQDYFQFTTNWQPDANIRGAMSNIIYQHGHVSIWNASLLEALLFYAGFDKIEPRTPGKSIWPELVGVDGHARVIGEKFNEIESCVMEAMK